MLSNSKIPTGLVRFGLAIAIWISSWSVGTARSANGSDQDLFKLGTVHYQRGQWDFAIQRFEEILKSSKDAHLRNLSRFYLAESLVAKKDFAAAQPHLMAFLKSNPKHLLTPQARFRLGEVSYMIGDRKVAMAELSVFAKSYPDHDLLEFALPYLGSSMRYTSAGFPNAITMARRCNSPPDNFWTLKSMMLSIISGFMTSDMN